MPANEIRLDASDLEVLQADPDTTEPSVLVRQDGVFHVQTLPTKQGATKTVPVGTTPTRYLAADHRRASAKLLSIGGNMLIAFNMASTGDPSRMAEWPANLQYVCTSDSEVWLAAKTGTVAVSIITEYWATGDR